MDPPHWIALLVAIFGGIQTGMKIREHLIDYPIRKHNEEEDPEGE